MNLFKLVNLLLFTVLSLIWGSSYILIKLGLYSATGASALSAYQVAALRALSAGLIAIPFALAKRERFPLKIWMYLIASGLFGMLIPAFFFCFAETRVDSSVAGILTVLAPIFLMLFNYLCFRITVSKIQITGVFIAVVGVVFLILLSAKSRHGSLTYAVFIVLATASYAINTLIVRHQLVGIQPLSITAYSFIPLIVPAMVVLCFSGYFSLPLSVVTYPTSTVAACLLGVVCSSGAWLIFYQLMKRTSALFASSVAFVIPIVACGWGCFYGEHITAIHLGCMLIILYGVYLTNPEFKRSLKSNLNNA